LLAVPLAAPFARAQQARRVYRIAWPAQTPRPGLEHLIAALEQGLRDLGYVPGKDFVIEVLSAEGKTERYPEVVREVVQSKPDVILTGTNNNTTAVMAVTRSIPIVMAIGTDVIGAGYAKSLAKPGGNITGIAYDVGAGILIKRLELLKEIAPGISRVVVLWESKLKPYQTPLDEAARVLGLRTFWHEFSGNPERDFAEMTRLRADAVYLPDSSVMYSQRAEIIALAAKHRLPAAFSYSEFVEAGGLMSYSPNTAGLFRSAARHIDKILKGAKPGDIPIEQPTIIDLAINLKTAKALGLKIPQSVLLRAERVIE
jgi:putative ABC transport system substrate-binding protein